MGLQEFQRGVRVHLRRYHAEQVVLQPYAVDGAYRVALHYEFEAAGETAGDLLLPVESYAYGHVVENEAGLAEQRGTGAGVEGELVV